ncbi:MAG: NTP transferase domain-containing protein [Pseudomonadota bacterium]|nr:NTP transferase domain-containing protein [Pseudomonadota bacterium]
MNMPGSCDSASVSDTFGSDRTLDTSGLPMHFRPPTAPQHPPLAATILAAGLGQRLGGRPKATLQIGGRSLLERLMAALRGAGIQAVSVVIGPYREQLLPLVARCGARVVAHSQAGASLIESQRLALDAHMAAYAGHDLLLVLADLPLLGEADILPLLAAWHQRAPGIHAQMPVVDGVRGHPLLLSSHAVAQIAATSRHLGIRDWLRSHPEAVQLVHTLRRAYVTDVDTPDDLIALQALVHPSEVTWPAP